LRASVKVTIPVAAEDVRVDYYAGLIAILAVILFAKFVVHRGKSEHDAKESLRAHVICVVSAGLGAVASLCVLGWGRPNGVEAVLRVTIGLLALVAALILLHDVTFGRGQKARDFE
jgi:uncharacterized membrane protein